MRFTFIDRHRSQYRITGMAKVLGVSESGYHQWKKRQDMPKTEKEKERDDFIQKVLNIYLDSNCVYGGRKIAKELGRREKKAINHKAVEKVLREQGIVSKVTRKYKATTNSHHNLPVYDNILNRDFIATRPAEKMVSDITYISTDEGWLYLACVMDLYGRKIVGMAMDGNMTKDLVIDALKDAKARTGNVKGCILHSDRGSQYCSIKYQNLLRAYGFECSMSRKGNCWDNAPMESFWGKLKQEWLNEQHFKTRDEAKKAVFEYIWMFYNSKRIHEKNDYMTPNEYYAQAA